MRITSYLLLLFVVFSYSCDVASFSGKLDEGTVEYDIVYLQDEKENPLISLLPTTMTLKFKDNVSIQKIEGWMGIFQMAGIANRDEDISIALMKIMNEKYYYETTLNGPSFGFDPMPDIKIVETDSTKTVAGYKCKKAEVYLADTLAFSIFYTTEIELEKPNIHNPFTMVEGVLMEYQYSFQNIPMRLIATKVIKEDVSDDEFLIPDGFTKVAKEKMQETISNLM